MTFDIPYGQKTRLTFLSFSLTLSPSEQVLNQVLPLEIINQTLERVGFLSR